MAVNQLKIGQKTPFEILAVPDYVWLPNLEQDLEEAHLAVANGSKTYKTAAELRVALDAEDADE